MGQVTTNYPVLTLDIMSHETTLTKKVIQSKVTCLVDSSFWSSCSHTHSSFQRNSNVCRLSMMVPSMLTWRAKALPITPVCHMCQCHQQPGLGTTYSTFSTNTISADHHLPRPPNFSAIRCHHFNGLSQAPDYRVRTSNLLDQAKQSVSMSNQWHQKNWQSESRVKGTVSAPATFSQLNLT